MKIVVGLGNPGEKYSDTRHNIGFMVIDHLLQNYKAKSSYNKKFDSLVYNLDAEKLLVKPQTFMNVSGKAVNRIVNFYKVKPEELLVIHDDVDLTFGQLKHQFGRGAAGHNGVGSIIESVGSDQFGRIRVGIGRPENPSIPIETWVLQKFTEKPSEIKTLIDKASEVAVNWLVKN